MDRKCGYHIRAEILLVNEQGMEKQVFVGAAGNGSRQGPSDPMLQEMKGRGRFLTLRAEPSRSGGTVAGVDQDRRLPPVAGQMADVASSLTSNNQNDQCLEAMAGMFP
jgi:hypothetical protein